ncbi:MAG: DUF4868 domain-containing protein [Firmicutes bacterium]|nr:DUF4868 domain-containing protein [Bacillota bacterium]
MSYDLVKEGLEKIKSAKHLALALISYNHKSRPMEYTCYSLNFRTDQLLKQTISEMCTCFIGVIDKQGRDIKNYTGANPKNVTDKIHLSNGLIKNQWGNLIQSLNVCDDNTSLNKIKSQAYIFSGAFENDEGDHNIYILSRKNPIYTYKKGRAKIFASKHNIIQEIGEPLVQFGKTFDALIYKGTMYTINNNFESVFNMEYTHKIVCKSSLEIIGKASIINNFEIYKSFALSKQHPRKFITFDKRIIDNIRQVNNLKILVDELKIPYDEKRQKFNLDKQDHAELFTKAICGKTKHNMFIGGICEVQSFIPLKI